MHPVWADLGAGVPALNEALAPKQRSPGIQWGCYQFDDEDKLFCTACYDTKGLKNGALRLRGSGGPKRPTT